MSKNASKTNKQKLPVSLVYDKCLVITDNFLSYARFVCHQNKDNKQLSNQILNETYFNDAEILESHSNLKTNGFSNPDISSKITKRKKREHAIADIVDYMTGHVCIKNKGCCEVSLMMNYTALAKIPALMSAQEDRQRTNALLGNLQSQIDELSSQTKSSKSLMLSQTEQILKGQLRKPADSNSVRPAKDPPTKTVKPSTSAVKANIDKMKIKQKNTKSNKSVKETKQRQSYAMAVKKQTVTSAPSKKKQWRVPDKQHAPKKRALTKRIVLKSRTTRFDLEDIHYWSYYWNIPEHCEDREGKLMRHCCLRDDSGIGEQGLLAWYVEFKALDNSFKNHIPAGVEWDWYRGEGLDCSYDYKKVARTCRLRLYNIKSSTTSETIEANLRQQLGKRSDLNLSSVELKAGIDAELKFTDQTTKDGLKSAYLKLSAPNNGWIPKIIKSELFDVKLWKGKQL